MAAVFGTKEPNYVLDSGFNLLTALFQHLWRSNNACEDRIHEKLLIYICRRAQTTRKIENYM